MLILFNSIQTFYDYDSQAPELFIFSSLISRITLCSDNEIDMADTMRSNGKIYVVVGVLSVILAGLIIFLLLIDKD